MIEVLKEGTKKQCVCEECGSILSYDNSDINNYFRFPILFKRYSRTIKCPKCQNIIEIKEES